MVLQVQNNKKGKVKVKKWDGKQDKVFKISVGFKLFKISVNEDFEISVGFKLFQISVDYALKISVSKAYQDFS